MADNTVLAATVREKVGKGSAREARRQGQIPAVIYGDRKSPLPITIEQRLLVRHLNTGGFFNTLFDVQVGGESHSVLPRDMQLHPVTDVPEHVDFLRVSASTQITVEVPVEFINEETCPGLKAGGVLNVVRYAIEVACAADKIPNSIVLDLGEAEMGDSLHISAVSLPDGVEPTITDRDFTIATIAAPTVVQDEADEADEDEDFDGAPTEDESGDEETED